MKPIDEKIIKQLQEIAMETPYPYNTIEACYNAWPNVRVIKKICPFAESCNLDPVTMLRMARDITIAIREEVKGVSDESPASP